MISGFFSRNCAGQKGIYLKYLKGKMYNQDSTQEDLIQIQRRNQVITDKQKIREFSNIKPASEEILKELL